MEWRALSVDLSVVWSAVQPYLRDLLVVGGGGAAVSFAVVRRFGDKWLESRFAQRLEKLRHEQASAIESIRYFNSRNLDRSEKLNARQFDVLPSIWVAMNEAISAVSDVMGYLRQYPDLDNMTDEQFESWLKVATLSSYQKGELKRAAQRNRLRVYGNIRDATESNEARASVSKFQHALREGAIFIDPDIEEKLQQYVDMLWAATIEAGVRSQLCGHSVGPLETKAMDRFSAENAQRRDELSLMIRARFNEDVVSLTARRQAESVGSDVGDGSGSML